MSIWLLYVLLVLVPGLKTLSAIIFLLSLAVYVVGLLACGLSIDDKDLKVIHESSSRLIKSKTVLAILILSGLFQIIIPGQRESMYIAGGYIVTNNEQLAQLPDNFLKVANKYLDKYASLDDEDTKPNKKAKKNKE